MYVMAIFPEEPRDSYETYEFHRDARAPKFIRFGRGGGAKFIRFGRSGTNTWRLTSTHSEIPLHKYTKLQYPYTTDLPENS
ncbi:hypothetical protein ANCDUO_17186 [Ancylostoma duodenale]|uniref:Uncharacterized protein n=1 Tax=Ancylostoma duodenale TaxID=51022 RepID=A0A0C2FVW3_9BILA|nr:hypothetical protein ANCDUO_17186 [Ancylostoma duodenale]